MPSKMKKDDDEDLKDLLSSSRQESTRASSTNACSGKRNVPGFYAGPKMSLVEFCSSYIAMMCFYYPTCCGCFAFLILVWFVTVLSTFLVNPIQTYGHIEHDHSNIASIYDPQMGGIDHWCLGGGNNNCPCEDPLQPVGRISHKSWIQAYKANQKLITQSLVSNTRLDVVFLGESVIEEMAGRWMGKNARSRQLVKLEQSFRKNFHKSHGAKVEGLALGIAGDSAANVLWRLLHGEITYGFDPAVWWISLGNNDLGRMLCSEEVVVIGILRVVEEIMTQRPHARIVINSVFPMMELRGGEYPVISDYKDSFVNQTTSTRRRALYDETESSSTTVAVSDEAFANEAEEEEAQRDAKAHVEKIFERQYRSHNNVLKDIEHVRKNRLGTFRAAKKPLWTSIKAINRQLKKFAESNADRGVRFYDAAELFVDVTTTTPGVKRSRLRTELISPRGHPTEYGFVEWENKVLQFLEPILAELESTNDKQGHYKTEDDYINAHIQGEVDDYPFEAKETDDGWRGDDMYPDTNSRTSSFENAPPLPTMNEATPATRLNVPQTTNAEFEPYRANGDGVANSAAPSEEVGLSDRTTDRWQSPVIAGTGDVETKPTGTDDFSPGATDQSVAAQSPDLSGITEQNAPVDEAMNNDGTRPLGSFTVVNDPSIPGSVDDVEEGSDESRRDEVPSGVDGDETTEDTGSEEVSEEASHESDSEESETRRDGVDDQSP